MKKTGLAVCACFCAFAAFILASMFLGRETVTGKVIQLSEVKVILTGEKLTVITLVSETTGANIFLAINGHGAGIKTGDRLKVVYSQRDLAAHRTDSMGNHWNYWRVKTWEKLPLPPHP